jgi:hypothetical protein
MSLKHLTIGALVAVCTLVAPAAGQKNELTGMFGHTFISDLGIPGVASFDQNVHFGKGWTYEINYSRRVFNADLWSLSLELPFLGNPDEDIHNTLDVTPRQYSSIFLTPAARLNAFPDQAVSPWISFGGGFGHFGPSSTLESGAPNPNKNGNTTGVLQAGVGLDVKLIGHFRLRGEARDFWSGIPNLNVTTNKSRQHNIFVGGGVVFRF